MRLVTPRTAGVPVYCGVFFDAGERTDYKDYSFVDRLRSLLAPERE